MDVEKFIAFTDRLKDLWVMMNDSMSQGHNHTIRVNPEMVDDIRSAEALLRMSISQQCPLTPR